MTTNTKADFEIIDTDSIAHLSTMTFKHLSRALKHSSENIPSFNEYVQENQVEKVFSPMRLILQILGRFPFTPVPTSKRNNNESDGKPYSDSLFTFHWLYFAITSIISLVIFFFMSMGFANVYLGWELSLFNNSQFHECEEEMFEENLVPFVLVWSCLLHSIVGNISFFKNRKLIVNYLNQWETTVKTLEVKLSISIRNYLIVANCWFLGFLAIVVFFYHFKILRQAVGGAEVIALLCLKPFIGNVLNSNMGDRHSWFPAMSAIANFALVYSMYASRALLFLYAYKCKLLRFTFKKWNQRVEKLLDENPYEMESSILKNWENLYRDHVILIKTVKETDKVFAGILQAYYASQIMNMCFELYYLARSGTFKSSSINCAVTEVNQHGDIVAAVLLLIQNVSIFLQVSLVAAYVQDEAQKGYDILRNKGVPLCFQSRPKRYFVQSLMQSFSQKIVMTGGKFFSIDRPFVITVLGAVCTYFVIILQFGDRLLKPTP
ncbi:unnamed protein product [Allacma fusca]|uniref:Gustatory receptor n=1 Tax=Allacma fusca TaxID=39272 RepID=A0A8J2J875_9HEXA|nr:unnamed protein product [Allacma fusca]